MRKPSTRRSVLSSRIIQAVSFDVWKTLLHGNKKYTNRRMRTIFDVLGHRGIPTDNLVQAYRATRHEIDLAAERSGLDMGLAEYVVAIYKHLGMSAERPSAEIVRYLQSVMAWQRLDPDYLPALTEPDLLKTLATLRDKGYKIGLLSNTGMDSRSVMVPLLDKLGILQFVDSAVFSSELGIAKPNPGMFAELANRLGVDVSEMIHIGDNRRADYDGALQAGAWAALYEPKKHGKHVAYRLSSLRELRTLP